MLADDDGNVSKGSGPIVKQCVACGDKFRTHQYLINKGYGKYCSTHCAGISTKSSKGGGQHRGNNVSCVCEQCGKTFTVTFSQQRAGRGKHCSLKCYADARRKRVEQTCLKCGKPFLTKPYNIENGNGVFCSVSCSASYRTGEKSARWCGGVSFEPYCIKFNREFKNRVRAFFGYECVACGRPERENERKLDVHHVEYNKSTCCDDSIPRFVALCQRHNTKANVGRDRWQYMFNYIIDVEYNGKCYFTKDEYQEMISR